MHPLASVVFFMLLIPFGAFTVPWTHCFFENQKWLFFMFSWLWKNHNVLLYSVLRILICSCPDWVLLCLSAKVFLVIIPKLQASWSLVYFYFQLVLLVSFFPLKSFLQGDDFTVLCQSLFSLWFLNYWHLSHLFIYGMYK